MKKTKTLTTALATMGAILGFGAVACADNVVTVKSGDTLSKIANDNNTTVSNLQKLNNIKDANKISIGQQIETTDQQTQSNFVIVKSGDTLSSIAQANHTTIEQLQAINHLANINELMPGQKIYLSGNVNVQSQNQTQVTTSSPKKVGTPVKQVAPATQTKTTVSAAQPAQPVKTVAQSNSNANVQSSDNLSASNAAAKAWIAQHESGGNYNATNGQYIGKYQLSAGYLHGDYSPTNQERCADQYVANRYGSWLNAQQHWENYGWY